MEGEIEWESKVDFKQDLEGDFLSSPGHVQVRSMLQLKFISLELDSEVGRLVLSFKRLCLSLSHMIISELNI